MPRDPVVEAYRQRIAKMMNPSPDRDVQTEMAKFRKLLEKNLEERRAEFESGAAQEKFRHFRRRIVAGLIDLSSSCKEVRCRRAGECKGEKTPCIGDHRDLVSKRLAIVLGYRPMDAKGGKHADILWPDVTKTRGTRPPEGRRLVNCPKNGGYAK